MKPKGILYLIPTTLGGFTPTQVLSDYVIKIVLLLDEFIVEDLRTARRFLKSIGYTKKIEEIIFHILNEHTRIEDAYSFLDNVLQGKNVGLLSEAGCPCIADPGNIIVRMAHKKDITIVPLVGPSSITLSLMASGFNGQHFSFIGYLPKEKTLRIKKIKELEHAAWKFNQTQIFIETPYRNMQLLSDLINTCRNDTLLCIATDITTINERIETKFIFEWEKKIPEINKKNTIFLLYK